VGQGRRRLTNAHGSNLMRENQTLTREGELCALLGFRSRGLALLAALALAQHLLLKHAKQRGERQGSAGERSVETASRHGGWRERFDCRIRVGGTIPSRRSCSAKTQPTKMISNLRTTNNNRLGLTSPAAPLAGFIFTSSANSKQTQLAHVAVLTQFTEQNGTAK
jgi:hypothetical protein